MKLDKIIELICPICALIIAQMISFLFVDNSFGVTVFLYLIFALLLIPVEFFIVHKIEDRKLSIEQKDNEQK